MRTIALMTLLFLSVGCSSDQPTTDKPVDPTPKTTPSEENTNDTPTAEDEAKQKLTETLDSWVFGDIESIDAWKQKYPTVTLLDERWSILPFDMEPPITLLKYEVNKARQTREATDKLEFTFEFIVILTLQDASKTDFTRKLKYSVTKKKSGQWLLIAGPA